jgi:hypothetical protein
MAFKKELYNFLIYRYRYHLPKYMNVWIMVRVCWITIKFWFKFFIFFIYQMVKGLLTRLALGLECALIIIKYMSN